jgi:hypothetical protein
VQDRRETLMAACQVAGISAAGLLLPCALIDMAFDTDFLSIAHRRCWRPSRAP